MPDDEHQYAPLAERARVGVTVASALLAVGTAGLLLIWLLAGPEFATRRGTLRTDLALAIYVVGGTAAGALLGMLAPYFRSTVGAVLLGMIAVAPLTATLPFAIDRGYRDWQGVHTFTALVMTVIFGSVCGLGLRVDSTKKPKPRRDAAG